MKLEIGKQYKDGWGNAREIRGEAKCGLVNGETVYWSLQGDWYTESGKKCIGEKGLWHEKGGPHDLREAS